MPRVKATGMGLGNMTVTETLIPVDLEILREPLGEAGLASGDLTWGSHPDTGTECLVLSAAIQQYGQFLVALGARLKAPHGPTGMAMLIAGDVQMEQRLDGNTWFWLQGLTAAVRET